MERIKVYKYISCLLIFFFFLKSEENVYYLGSLRSVILMGSIGRDSSVNCIFVDNFLLIFWEGNICSDNLKNIV